ncbi:protein GVQW3-like [Camponotus floridanus]|uniref:protein GVQW3-like n=1 Tax=Camponotus floridanus TaxID=104421 RepID=UPI000DC6C757|nr:protein GVQW3-like [Camponotus floridanus]
MDKKEFRAVIKHFFLKGKTATQIQAELQEVHGTSTPSLPTISFWVNEFKRGRTNTDDEPRSGRPKTATNEEMVSKVIDIVMSDRRLKLREIVEMVGISEERIFHILHEILGMRKLTSRWVPRLLTVENKHVRMTISKQCLDLFKRNPREFFRRYVTVDETWIHHYTPETKQQSKQWTLPEKGKTITGKYYADLLDRFNKELKEKRPDLAKKSVVPPR